MGLAGIALATSISYALACLILGIFIGLLPPFRETRPYQNWWRPDFGLMKTMLKIGAPNACIVVSETGMFIVAAFIIGLFGAGALLYSPNRVRKGVIFPCFNMIVGKKWSLY